MNDTYSESSFWDKIYSHAKNAGRFVIVLALKLYFALTDPDTPVWAKTVIIGALAYFIMPIDAIPDFLPGGYVDDIGVLTTALGTVAAHIKEEHVAQAEKIAVGLF